MCLEPDNASTAQSTNPAPMGPQPPPCPSDGTFSVTALAVPSPLAPGKETIKIAYRVTDDTTKVTGGKIEVFRKKDNVLLKTLTLAAGDLTPGSHEVPWDGAIDAHADFPDAFVTAEHSPYSIEITLTGACKGSPDTQTAELKVELDSLEVELGDRAKLTDPKHLKIYDALGSLPAAGASATLKLESNLFKTSSAEMNATSGASFTEYQTLWGQGPKLPLRAKLWFKTSTGTKVLAPKAWGKRKLVWDWEDVPEDTSGLNARAKTYVRDSVDYDRAKTKPKGDNGHADRGGKRSANGKPEVLLPLGGFTARAGAKRVWALFGEPAKSGADEGQSCVIFQPSRLAGDAFRLKVYFEPDPSKDLDVETALAAPFEWESGTFTIWREIHVSAYKKKKATIASYNHGTLAANFVPAFMEVVDKTGGHATTMPKASYDADFNAAIATYPDLVKKHAIDPTASQYDATEAAVAFRSYADFKASLVVEEEAKLIAAGTAAPAARTQAQATVATFLTAQSLQSAPLYANKCNQWGLNIAIAGCKNMLGPSPGITLLQFNRCHNQEGLATTKYNGVAPSGMVGSGRYKQAFIQFALGSSYSGGSNSLEQTVSHEIGHHLFLPHRASPSKTPAGHQPDAHDAADAHCMMTYNYSAPREFCGLCLLRMRGWDHRKLDKNAASNKK